MQKWLYDISERIEALQAVLDEQDGKSIAPDIKNAIAANIAPDIKNAIAAIYESDVPAAVADGISYIKGQELQIDAIGAEIKRLQELKKARENRLARVRQGYTDFLIAVNKKKMETPRGTMTVAAATYSTVIDNIDELPDEYKRTTIKVEPDKAKIKEAISAGVAVTGAHLEANQSIRIK